MKDSGEKEKELRDLADRVAGVHDSYLHRHGIHVDANCNNHLRGVILSALMGPVPKIRVPVVKQEQEEQTFGERCHAAIQERFGTPIDFRIAEMIDTLDRNRTLPAPTEPEAKESKSL